MKTKNQSVLCQTKSDKALGGDETPTESLKAHGWHKQ